MGSFLAGAAGLDLGPWLAPVVDGLKRRSEGLS